MRILVIEDEKKVAQFLKQGLEEEHYAVDVASDGERGESLASSEEYDLIILDVQLPDMDGYTVCDAIRHNSSTWQIPIIMVTVEGQRAARLQMAHQSVDDALDAAIQPGRHLDLRIGGDQDAHQRRASMYSE